MNFKILITLCFIVIARCVNGIPLESASENLERYFSSRIVGGTNTPEGQAPYMVALLFGEMFTLIACSGSLVLPNLVLTSASCIAEYTQRGRFLDNLHGAVGSNNWHRGATYVELKGFHIHPQWNSTTLKNNIGFLELEKKLVLSERIQLVTLNFDWVGAGEVTSVTGWGRISNWGMSPYHLQVLEVDTISSQLCIDEVKDTAIWWGGAPAIDPATELCTYKGRVGLCHGDAGSALMLKKTGTQIGVASWAFTCAVGAPDMYTRLSAFKKFILEILNLYQ